MTTKTKAKEKAKSKKTRARGTAQSKDAIAAQAAKAKAAAKKAKAAPAAKEAKDQKAKDTAALRKLDSMADDINARIKKANKHASDADDMQLSASLQLEVARQFCATHNIPWQKWCEENIKEWAVDTIRKMIGVIKGAKNIKEAQKMITDQRKKEAKRQRKAVKDRTTAKSRATAGVATPAGPSAAKLSDFEKGDQTLAAMSDKDQHAVASSRMGKLGFAVISSDDLKALKAKADRKGDGIVPPDPKEVMKAFLAMKAMHRVEFVRKAADHIGFTVTDPFEGQHKDDTGDVPASMARKGTETGRTVAEAAAGK